MQTFDTRRCRPVAESGRHRFLYANRRLQHVPPSDMTASR